VTQYAVRRRARGRIERLRRLIRYRLIIPVFRSPHPPEYTARGVAYGVLWGMTPFMGLQTLLIFSTWAVLRQVFRKESSVVQALIWAWVNNPVTMIPMYYVFFVTGAWAIGSSESIAGYDAFVAVWDASQAEETWLASVGVLAREVGLALSIGCIPYTLVCSWLSYRWALRVVRARRRRIAP
jgi:uncharacterized protein (DUF2062 family)